jgi:hypothetical protein
MIDVEEELGKAVKHFWKIRSRQQKRQGSGTGRKDAGNRAAVTGGKHADGFVQLIAAIIHDARFTQSNHSHDRKDTSHFARVLSTNEGMGLGRRFGL